MLFVVLNTALSLTTLVVLLWKVGEYIRVRRQIRKLISLLHTKTSRMQMDDLLEGLLAEETAGAAVEPAQAAQPGPTTAAQRERLTTVVAGGQARQYLGKAWSVEEIDALGDDEVGKLYARYEARMGAVMTKTLGRTALQLYTAAASLLLPIPPENQKPLMEDLESDPFVGHALTSTACELYYRHGKLLAPITAALTTVKYCQFGHQYPGRIEEDGQQCDGNTHAGGDTHAGGVCCGATVSTGATGATSFEGDGRDDAGTKPVA